MKAVVHLGLNKTGTTTLQKWLMDNRAELLAQNINYDRFDGKSWTQRGVHPTNQGELSLVVFSRLNELLPFKTMHDGFGFSDLSGQKEVSQKVETRLKKIAKEGGQDTCLLSSEYLGAWLKTPKRIRVLDDWLSSLFSHVRYVMYIRNPEYWLISQYSQAVTYSNRKVPFDEFVQRMAHVGYRALVNPWRAIVGQDRFDLRLFDEKWISQDGLLQDFAKAMDIDTGRTQPVNRQNISPDAQTIHNHVVGIKKMQPERPTFVRRIASKIGFSSLNEPRSDGERLTLSPAQKQLVRKANAEDVNWIHHTFFPDRQQIFEGFYKTKIGDPPSKPNVPAN